MIYCRWCQITKEEKNKGKLKRKKAAIFIVELAQTQTPRLCGGNAVRVK